MSYQHVVFGAEQKAWVNHRAVVRYQCAPATPGQIIVLEDREYQCGWVLDLSTAGIGLELSRPVPVGSLAAVRLKSPKNGKLYELTAEVIHSTPKLSGEYIVGCKFITPLAKEDLEALL